MPVHMTASSIFHAVNLTLTLPADVSTSSDKCTVGKLTLTLCACLVLSWHPCVPLFWAKHVPCTWVHQVASHLLVLVPAAGST